MKNRYYSQEEQHILADIMSHRRDVRGNQFVSTPIEDEVLTQILNAVSVAPSVGFSQPWKLVLIREKETKLAVAENFRIANQLAKNQFEDSKADDYARLKLEGIMESPLNIAVFYLPSDGPVLGQHSMPEMGEYSVVCAIQNMWLMARALNVGMGWVSIIDPEFIKSILNAPAESKLIAYLCLGYVNEFYEKPELEMMDWASRKTLEQFLSQESFNNN